MTGSLTNRVFVDVSVLVRLFDDDEPRRQAAARAVIGDIQGATLVISTRVMADFYDIVTREFARPLPGVVAGRALADLADLAVVQVDHDLVAAAADTADRHDLEVRDALAVEAAATAGCGRLLTEALPHGTVLRGLVVEDPANWEEYGSQ
ncbi:MAG TPA: PIN domain-containing protein [Acidimicrobiales bacterium]|jgi:predicted nucleic acid-binding protein|nr:PIN domain-containing protein [Acidimicrobiales bacterium]MDP7209284.1 PIN domain-containing protein [Acidimicrobiales bacterium]HJL88948.1 PIN domain-containing protein [Acidimicrobiales bacterium]HJO99285.1 PIN domain-containing protein [Acidimicrobiales bacterium]|tara:strand:+ start:11176 stop:11625 length:450 start_codon:yes stop_codon:yes gene_type:complete